MSTAIEATFDFRLEPCAPPLYWERRTLRVEDSRVLLELVMRAYFAGATPEEIAESYSTLSLASVYGVVAYYLKHREQIDQYLAQRETHAAETRRWIESVQPDRGDIRARLMARKRS
jgi:uncharacterized protein (DUF433 family)